jgi:hypothetical protein
LSEVGGRVHTVSQETQVKERATSRWKRRTRVKSGKRSSLDKAGRGRINSRKVSSLDQEDRAKVRSRRTSNQNKTVRGRVKSWGVSRLE